MLLSVNKKLEECYPEKYNILQYTNDTGDKEDVTFATFWQIMEVVLKIE